MSGRKGSTVSILSDRNRTLSVSHHHRKAELSARIEEGRPVRPPLAREEDVTFSFRQDFFSKPREHVTTLTRADTSQSPLEVHPGSRLRGASIAERVTFANHRGFDTIRPWPEPTAEEEEDIERRHAVIERVQTDPLEASYRQTQIRQSVSELQTTRNPVRSLLARLRGRSAVKHSTLEGLRASSGVITAHANALLLKRPAAWEKWKQLAIFDYEIKEGTIFSCDVYNSFPSKTKLEAHLNEIDKTPALRIIRICNNDEAVNHVEDAFAISPNEAHYDERGFGKWMQAKRDQRRATNMTIRWRPGYDTNRGMICGAVGLDFGPLLLDERHEKLPSKETKKNNTQASSSKAQAEPPQKRIAIYMQRSLSSAVPGPKVTQFTSRLRDIQKFTFKSSDTLLICENSSDSTGTLSNSAHIRALSPIDNSFDRLPGSTGLIASALRHCFEEVAWYWETQIHLVHESHAEIEDMIYARPADATHARRVWSLSQRLHSMQKLINRHLELIETFKDDFRVFAELDREADFLDDSITDLRRLSNAIHGDYIEPLEHMIDLMYKSITIRDSSLSLQLNSSLWRLSWVTFIFLPMTFMVGFFGMNVDTFHKDPSIKWYFVALIPLFGVVFLFWFSFRGLDTRAKKLGQSYTI